MQIEGVSYAPLRGKVTRAAKAAKAGKVGAIVAIVETAREVKNFFDKNGWPDNWPSWRNALGDAVPYHSEARGEIERLLG